MSKKILIICICFAFLPILASASFPFDSNKFLPPPVTVNVQFGRLDLEKFYVVSVSGIWDAISNKLALDVGGSGSFSKTITVDNQRHSADKFVGGVVPEDGVFTLSGRYNKGHVSAEWTYELTVPPREGWKFPETYVGGGTFYTTQVITETSGAGIIEGSLTLSKTEWKDKKMVDHAPFSQTDNFKNTWTASGQCKALLCGCFDYGDATDSQARFNSITGEVGIAHCNKEGQTEEWIPATPKVILLVDDHISTGQDSSAILQFQDMTTFQMKPETEVIVKSPPAQETKLGLVSGHLWINFKKMLTNGTMEVEMGQAVSGIKGTTLVLGQINGVSSLKVIEGVVTFTAKETGESVDVKTGEKVSADFNGLSKVEKFDVAEESAGWKSLEEAKSAKQTGGPAKLLIIAGIVFAALLLIFFFKKKKSNI